MEKDSMTPRKIDILIFTLFIAFLSVAIIIYNL